MRTTFRYFLIIIHSLHIHTAKLMGESIRDNITPSTKHTAGMAIAI